MSPETAAPAPGPTPTVIGTQGQFPLRPAEDGACSPANAGREAQDVQNALPSQEVLRAPRRRLPGLPPPAPRPRLPRSGLGLSRSAPLPEAGVLWDRNSNALFPWVSAIAAHGFD